MSESNIQPGALDAGTGSPSLPSASAENAALSPQSPTSISAPFVAPPECAHARYVATCNVVSFSGTNGPDGKPCRMIEIRVKCAGCGKNFVFTGIGDEFGVDRAHLCEKGLVANLPIHESKD